MQWSEIMESVYRFIGIVVDTVVGWIAHLNILWGRMM